MFGRTGGGECVTDSVLCANAYSCVLVRCAPALVQVLSLKGCIVCACLYICICVCLYESWVLADACGDI